MNTQAVLTGDIVNSTKISAAAEKKLLKVLQQVLAAYKFEFYRGDSFQVYIKNPAEACPIIEAANHVVELMFAAYCRIFFGTS